MAGIIEVKDQGKLRIYDADNSHYIDIVVPSSVTANRTITIPDASFTVPQADTNTVYTHPNHSGEVTSTSDGATVIADNIVDEANLKVSNSAVNGYMLTAQSGNTGGLTWAAAPGGITEIDAWYLDTEYVGEADITANLERVAAGGFAKLGTGMSQSSGIFTFPSTGIWRIEFIAQFQDSGHDNRSIWTRIKTTVNNSSYVTASSHGTNLYRPASGVHYVHGITSFIFDVTNTSTHKVLFNAGATDIGVRGSDPLATTQMQFIRLGDT